MTYLLAYYNHTIAMTRLCKYGNEGNTSAEFKKGGSFRTIIIKGLVVLEQLCLY